MAHDRARTHLADALSNLSDDHSADLSLIREFLEHNEFRLAFDAAVDAAKAEKAAAPLAFWKCLDKAAREMRLYSLMLDSPHVTSVDECLRRLAAASEPGGR